MGIFFFWLKVSRRWRRNLTNKIIGMKLLAQRKKNEEIKRKEVGNKEEMK